MSVAIGVLTAVLCGGFNDSLMAFPIGCWNYAPIEVFDEAKIQEWQDVGFTLTMGPEYAPTPENVARMKQVLDWSQARDIKVIVCDPRPRARAPLPPDFAQQAAAAIGDFGAHPATFGFHVLDEPDTAAFEPTCEAVRLIKQAAPKLSPFVNLLPWHPGVNGRVGYDDFSVYLDDYVKKSGVEFLCYDCYSQMNPGNSGWPMYFKNLTLYGEAARRNGIPFWTTILSVGHYHYRCPSEDDIRWQFNSAVAYGAQGILYFFFYMRQPHENYRLSPIDEFYQKTPLFDSLRRVNKGFVKRYGRLFLELKLEKAMQYPEPAAGCLAFEADAVLKSVRADGDRPLIVSRFSDPQGRPWVAVVNNSTGESCQAALAFQGADTRAYTMDWDARETPVGVEKREDSVEVTHWLAPGQMEVFRVEATQ